MRRRKLKRLFHAVRRTRLKTEDKAPSGQLGQWRIASCVTECRLKTSRIREGNKTVLVTVPTLINLTLNRKIARNAMGVKIENVNRVKQSGVDLLQHNP